MEKLLSELISVPEGCTCVAYSQDFSNGYIVETRCAVCEALQQIQNIAYSKEIRRQAIVQELNRLDLSAIRPILDNETERIAAIQAAKVILRAELASL
jgi:hypothetical protein